MGAVRARARPGIQLRFPARAEYARWWQCVGLRRALLRISQQSLHFKHFSQIWLSHASLVHRTQIRVEGSSQILHWNGIEWLSFPGRLAGRGQQGAATLRFAVHHLQLLLLIRGEIDQVPLEAASGWRRSRADGAASAAASAGVWYLRIPC